MSKSITKKLTALAICVLIVVMSTTYAFAVETEVATTEAEKSVQWLDETITLNNNQLYFTTYNLTENNTWGVRFRNDDSAKTITKMFKDCVVTPQLVNTISDEKYALYIIDNSGSSGSRIYNFNSTGGTYRKARVKLSAISNNFNEDGSYTKYDHNFYFGDDEVVGGTRYSAGLAIVSGCVVNGVSPDKDGYVEIYISTKIGEGPRYYTDFSKETLTSVSGGGGTNGGTLSALILGAVNDNSSVYISDATNVQMYTAKLGTLDEMQKFRADVNLDGKINILDATKIQSYVSKIDF